MDVFSSVGKYLVQPLPLERNSNLYENCNDACEVNVTHDLGRKRRKHNENNSTILIEPLFPEKWLKQFPDNSLCQTSLFMLLDKHGRTGSGLCCSWNVQMTQAIANIFKLQQEMLQVLGFCRT